MKTLMLPKPVVLSAESFREARAILGKALDAPLTLFASTEDTRNAAFLRMLHPPINVQEVPAEMLKTPHSWCLEGYRHAVLSLVP